MQKCNVNLLIMNDIRVYVYIYFEKRIEKDNAFLYCSLSQIRVYTSIIVEIIKIIRYITLGLKEQLILKH